MIRSSGLVACLLLACVSGCGDDETQVDSPPAAGGQSAGGAGGAGGDANAGGTGNTAGAASELDGLVIDDFEDGNQQSLLGGGWYTYTDSGNGGASKFVGSPITISDEAYQSKRALLTTFELAKGTAKWDPFIGLGTQLTADVRAKLNDYEGIAYVYRGSAHDVRIELSDVKDYDYHTVKVPASAAWRTVLIPFEDFRQGDWGAPVKFDPTRATSVSFHVVGATGTKGSLALDNLRLLETGSIPRTPDLVVRPPAPPKDVELESVAVDNPLQARVMQYLDKGYNITNWLEQGPFKEFGQYDESFVKKLADAGFKSVRLPIDLDLFVESRTGTGDDLKLTVSEDLFTVLDSFDAWTKTHGLGFTIDYHQYDKSLNFADATKKAETVKLWGLVAEHFADNPREDLFFELLNEPELSVDGKAPTAEEWGTLATAMVDAIRVHDTTHTIIFGDVQWYGIGALTKRTPLADPNLVYAFHFYDPFVFTHQGASWAGMATTHDIPYPYSEERWSTVSRDFGFSPLNELWQRQSLQGYYVTGTRSALRNRIIEAKQWGIKNKVPVLCNEFGAYDRTSREEDRVRYYEDLIDIFKELEIPWQIWFMIMDPKTGAVDPDYVKAFELK
jgi:licheninase